jgi:thiamine transport system permease protein
MKITWRTAGLAVPPLLFICLFLLYPLARILAVGLAPLSALGLKGFAETASSIGLGRLLLYSAAQALASTALSLALGLPAAYVFSRLDFPARRLLLTLLTVPFVLPAVVVGAAFSALLGPRGLIERLAGFLTASQAPELGLLYTLPAVLMAHVFYNVSVVVRIVGGLWTNLDPRLGEAAQALGAGKHERFFSVTVRLLLPAVAAAGVLVFGFCFASFGVILILGGPRIATLETEVYKQAIYFFNLPAAALLSAIQLLFTALLMSCYARLQSVMRVTMNLVPAERGRSKPATTSQRVLVAAFGVGLPCLLMLPLSLLVAGSFLTPRGIGLDYWKALFVNLHGSLFWSSPLPAAGNSLLFCALAVLFSLGIGIPASYLLVLGSKNAGRRKAGPAGVLDVLFLLPLGASAVTLGFGFLISLNRPPLDLRGSLLLIPIAHALVAMPLVTRSLLTHLNSLDNGLREAAALLGAGPVRTVLSVDFPILRRALLGAAAFAFTVSLGEFAATALLTRPELATIPVLIYGYLSRPGELNQGQALAMSTVLMAVCVLGLAAIERVRAKGSEIF